MSPSGRRVTRIALALVLLVALAAQAEGRHYDVLELPAVRSAIASKSLLYSLTRVNDQRLVATGIRGHVLLSDDQGRSWRQAEAVPVRSSLLAASFPSPEQGWVVGHEGVILHSQDGGRNWVRQLDGVQLARRGLEYYQTLRERHPDDERYAVLVDEMQLALEGNADRPFFTILMRNEREGIVAGAYGLLLATSDGGATWQPIMERLDLEQYVHLYACVELPAVDGDGPVRILAGEMGTILVEDVRDGSWRRQPFPYEGSLFTLLVVSDGALIAAGLRGRVFRSADRGQTWQEVDKPVTDAIVASIVLADGRILLGAQNGVLLASSDGGRRFAALSGLEVPLLSGLAEAMPGEIVASGSFGVRTLVLPEEGEPAALRQDGR